MCDDIISLDDRCKIIYLYEGKKSSTLGRVFCFCWYNQDSKKINEKILFVSLCQKFWIDFVRSAMIAKKYDEIGISWQYNLFRFCLQI